MQKTIDQRVEWLEELNVLVTKDEFRDERDITRREFGVKFDKGDAEMKKMEARIDTLDGNLRGIKWLIIVVLATLVSMGLPGAIMSYSQIAMKLFFSK